MVLQKFGLIITRKVIGEELLQFFHAGGDDLLIGLANPVLCGG